MKPIKRSSWHYKLNEWQYSTLSQAKYPTAYNNICSYFWHTIANIVRFISYYVIGFFTMEVKSSPKVLIPGGPIDESLFVALRREKRQTPFIGVILIAIVTLYFILIGVMGTILLLPIINLIPALIYGWSGYWFFMPDFTIAAFLCYVIGVLVCCGLAIIGLVSGEIKVKLSNDSLFYNFFKSVKNKYCMKIEFEETTDVIETKSNDN